MFKHLARLIHEERFLAIGLASSAIFLALGEAVTGHLSSPLGLGFLFVWLFCTVIGCGLAVVRHAEHLALRLGEPYGTLILTLAMTAIEVISISTVITHGSGDPGLARDTVFAVVMIVLNGLVGLSLLLGGWRHREQQYNLQGANSYLGVLIPLTVLTLILPNYTISTPGPTLSDGQEIFVAVAAIGLYLAFLAVQTVRHRAFFVLEEGDGHEPLPGTKRPIFAHAALLLATMAPLVFLAEQLGHPVDALLEDWHAPAALGGLVIALLVATPEAVGAVRAAAANRLQGAMNIFLGAVLATTGLTIPAMIALSRFTGQKIALGLAGGNQVLLLLTLVSSLITFSSGRTNVLQGAVHLVLFAVYILLLFQG